MYLITALKVRAADVLHGILTNATFDETLQALEDRFGDQHFAAAFRSQLKTRTQSRRIPTEFCHSYRTVGPSAYPTLPEEHIRQEAGKAFAYGIEDPDIKIKLLLGGEETVNGALRQAVLLAARPPKTSFRTFWGSQSPPTRRRDARNSTCWSCGEPGHFENICPYRRKAENDRRWKPEDRPKRETRESPRRSEWRATNNEEINRRGRKPSGK
jgi:hypothetical protein